MTLFIYIYILNNLQAMPHVCRFEFWQRYIVPTYLQNYTLYSMGTGGGGTVNVHCQPLESWNAYVTALICQGTAPSSLTR